MKSTKYLLSLAALACFSSIGFAQINDDLDRDSWNVPEGDWTLDDNWVDVAGGPSGAPELDFERWGLIANRGTAIVDSDAGTGALQLTSGTVDIRQGGNLTIAETNFTDGVLSIGRNGVLQLSGNGEFNGAHAVNEGIIDVGGGASFSITGDLTHNGELLLAASGDGLASLAVGGNVTLAGSISPAISSQPAFGDSFEIITGADSITDAGASLVLPAGISVGRGLSFGLETDGGSASLVVRNAPIMTVDRVTGEVALSNVVGDAMEITGYSIFSDNELLKTEGWGAGDGWAAAAPRPGALAELNLDGTATLTVGGDALSLGSAYNAANGASPGQEDLRVEVALADGTIIPGQVEYTGPANNLTLRVDPETGEAQIEHRSSFVGPFDVTGYSILSPGGALKVDGWNQLGGDWTEANPTASALAEFNVSNSQAFGNNDTHVLGSIFDTSMSADLAFEFTTVGGEAVFIGTVEYGALEGGGGPQFLPGDINQNGTVDFPDFLILSANFGMAGGAADGDINGNGTVDFPDFLVLSSNFGQSAAIASVPEPSSLSLIGLAALGLLRLRKQR